MDTPRTVLQAIRENDFMLTTDLKNAYFQMPVQAVPSYQRGFHSNNVTISKNR